jgi:hypothetical protein
MAIMDQRIARGEERLEAIAENVRILRLLFAYQEGAITALEFVERVSRRGARPAGEVRSPARDTERAMSQENLENLRRRRARTTAGRVRLASGMSGGCPTNRREGQRVRGRPTL